MLSEWAYQNESKVQWLTDLGRQIYNFHFVKIAILEICNTFKSEIFSKIKIQGLQNDQNYRFCILKLPNFISRISENVEIFCTFKCGIFFKNQNSGPQK